MAKHPISTGTPTPDTATPLDQRFAGFCYTNWDINGAPPIMVNPHASLHHKVAWLWGEVSVLNDLLHDLDTSGNKQLRTFSNFISSRLMPMEAMLDHLGDITDRDREGQAKS